MKLSGRTRRRITALLVAEALASLTSLIAFAGDVKLIANPTVKSDTITPAEIKRIFLLEGNSLDDGTRVEPVLKRSGSTHEMFLKKFLGTNGDALQAYYGTQVFTGKGSMPKQLGSDAEIVTYVAKRKGAIGYVSEDAATEGVKTLVVATTGSGVQRKLISRIEPEYPETLDRLNIGGTVRLQITIAAKGNVEKVELLGGNPILAEAAIPAVRQWVYSPGSGRTTTEVIIPFSPRH
jgi:TonB family protein